MNKIILNIFFSLISFIGTAQSNEKLPVFHDLLFGSLEDLNYFFKQCNLEVDDCDEIQGSILLTYASRDIQNNNVIGGYCLIKMDFKTIVNFNLTTRNQTLQYDILKEMDKNGFKFMSLEKGRTIYSNGIYEIYFKQEYIGGIYSYLVDFWKINY